MNSAQSFHINRTRLPEGQTAWVATLMSRVGETLNALTAEERVVYTALWKLMATFEPTFPAEA